MIPVWRKPPITSLRLGTHRWGATSELVVVVEDESGYGLGSFPAAFQAGGAANTLTTGYLLQACKPTFEIPTSFEVRLSDQGGRLLDDNVDLTLGVYRPTESFHHVQIRQGRRDRDFRDTYSDLTVSMSSNPFINRPFMSCLPVSGSQCGTRSADLWSCVSPQYLTPDLARHVRQVSLGNLYLRRFLPCTCPHGSFSRDRSDANEGIFQCSYAINLRCISMVTVSMAGNILHAQEHVHDEADCHSSTAETIIEKDYCHESLPQMHQ